jgi:hypothetical protein
MAETAPSDLSTRVGMISGWGILIFMGVGLWFGQFIAPPGPFGARVTAQFYRDDVDVKRLAVICLIMGGVMMIPFGAAIADRLRHVPGIGVPMALAQLGGAFAGAILMMAFGPILLVALLFPDMPDTILQFSNHITWMVWSGIWQPGALQAIAIATVVFLDKSRTPVFSRWVAWFCLFMAFGALTGSLIPFFTAGPFAWNGAIAFYVAGINYFTWFAILLSQFHQFHRDARKPCLRPTAHESQGYSEQVVTLAR